MSDLPRGEIIFPTKLGRVRLTFSSGGVTGLKFCRQLSINGSIPNFVKQARRQLRQYAAGKRIRFTVLLDLSSGTKFQQLVWKVLQKIPDGETRSYAWVARQIGNPKAARAVGAACGANPVLLLVPCHRVVASDGGLGGFSCGLPLKRQLLNLEAR